MKRAIRFIVIALIVVLVIVENRERLFPSSTLQLAGTLELTEHSLGARVPGRLSSLTVDEGDAVTAGQVLATLDRFDQAMKDYQRAQQLYQHGGATVQAVEQAKLAVDDQQVVAPVDGVVLLKVHEPGEVLAAGSAVVVVGESGALWVRVYVPEGLVSRLALGQSATLHVDGMAHPYHGRISFIATKAEFTPRNVQSAEERVTQAFAVKVIVDDHDAALRPGVSADVTFDMRAR